MDGVNGVSTLPVIGESRAWELYHQFSLPEAIPQVSIYRRWAHCQILILPTLLHFSTSTPPEHLCNHTSTSFATSSFILLLSFHSLPIHSIPSISRWLLNHPSPCSTSMTWTAWSAEVLLPLLHVATTKHLMSARSLLLLGPSPSPLRAQAAFATPQDMTLVMACLSIQTMAASGTCLNSLAATFVLEA